MSSTTSQKFRDFTGEPLKDKLLNEVPGIGPKLAGNLEQSGITKVRDASSLFADHCNTVLIAGLRTTGHLPNATEKQRILRTVGSGQRRCQSTSSKTMC